MGLSINFMQGEEPSVTTYLFVTTEDYEPTSVKRGTWSCSKTTQSGDRALVYLVGTGIVCEWEVTSDAVKDLQWGYVCDVSHLRTLKKPISIGEIKEKIQRETWAAPYTNFRGMKSIRIPDEALRALR